jgi:hypothetical protein
MKKKSRAALLGVVGDHPHFSDPITELAYCLEVFCQREKRDAMTSYVSPHSKSEVRKLLDWCEMDFEGFTLYERAKRAIKRALEDKERRRQRSDSGCF